ncbi:MAG: hypothetical protein IJD17_03180, partial [Clostridia bacterium]|nr:hypothetical protein [Clostridia bacterium]
MDNTPKIPYNRKRKDPASFVPDEAKAEPGCRHHRTWFESVSGFTTTGATILNDIEVLPRGLLFWR